MERQYSCPMHPEIKQHGRGHCPKCGMDLVLAKELESSASTHQTKTSSWKDYIPLLVIIGLLVTVTKVLAFHDLQTNSYSLSKTISYFMIGFFITFAGFKLIDLKGFAQGYSTYDLLAQKFFPYGYIYPFIELFFALAMILQPKSQPLLIAEFLIMVFSGLGVAIKLLKKEQFQCACLGTFLKVPLTKVTLVEDFGMAFLALVLLLK